MKDNKVLLVTGASSDIGLSLIRRIADNYQYIIAHYNHSNEKVEELSKEYGDKIIPVQADFKSEESIKNMIDVIIKKEIYPDHILHLSARRFHLQKFHKEAEQSFMEEQNTSVLSIIQILQAFIPKMIKNKYGKIVFMLTSNVIGQPAKYQSVYTMSKYALLGLMKSLAAEYTEKGICVNGISPDMIETNFLSDIPELVVSQNAGKSALKRNLNVDDVVPTIAYLLSDSADAISGANIEVTGGNK